MVSTVGGFLGAGLLGSAVLSLILAKFPYARCILFVCISVGGVFYMLTFLAFSKHVIGLMIGFAAIMGFFLVPVKGILFSCCCGTTTEATEHVIIGVVKSVYSAGSVAAVRFGDSL